jgi:hypothetical protein
LFDGAARKNVWMLAHITRALQAEMARVAMPRYRYSRFLFFFLAASTVSWF